MRCEIQCICSARGVYVLLCKPIQAKREQLIRAVLCSYVAMCMRLVRKIKQYNTHQIERESELTLICFLHTTLICRMGMRFYFHDQPGRAKVKRDISSKSSCIFQCIVH